MMDAKHTPGPWRLSDGMIQCRGHWSDSVGNYFDWEYPRILATVTDDWDQYVNGNLFAAAPDMLAALEIAEAFISGFEDDETQDGITETLAAIRAAIAKAKGIV